MDDAVQCHGKMANNRTIAVLKSNFAVVSRQLKQTLHVKELFSQPSALVKATLRPTNRRRTMASEHYNNGLGACLADDMGLGKTLQTLSTAVQEKLDLKSRKYPTRFVWKRNSCCQRIPKSLDCTSSSLVFNWYNEARKFTLILGEFNMGQDRN
jgi:non-specific serine/threonine protein kinase